MNYFIYMVRNYVRKTERGKWSGDNMLEALATITRGMTIGEASRTISIPARFNLASSSQSGESYKVQRSSNQKIF